MTVVTNYDLTYRAYINFLDSKNFSEKLATAFWLLFSLNWYPFYDFKIVTYIDLYWLLYKVLKSGKESEMVELTSPYFSPLFPLSIIVNHCPSLRWARVT